jgi:hypothetical protein
MFIKFFSIILLLIDNVEKHGKAEQAGDENII